MDLTATITLAIFCLLSEGFFSGCEYLLISFDRVKLRHLAESGSEGAKTFERLLKNPERVFGATSLGTNIFVFAGASLVTAYLASRVGESADIYSFLIMGPLTLILGEIAPKILFSQKAETMTEYVAGPLEKAQTLFSPLLKVTSAIARGVASLFRPDNGEPVGLITREELHRMTRKSDSNLDIAHDERKMIDRIFEFRTTNVESVMRPLVNLVAVSSSSTVAQAKERIAKSGYSRLPVYNERIYNIVGIVSAFDILRNHNQNETVDKLMQPVIYTPITRRSSSLMREMNQNNVHMAIAVDEYGGSVGVVTVEDLVEEIVGEIEDEYDSPIKFYEKTGEGKYVIDAMMEVDSLNEELGFTLPTGDYETVSGFMNDALERIPKKGTMMATGPYLIKTLDSTPQRLLSVEIIDVRVTDVDKDG